jgi:hypothetical protein
VDVSEYPPRPTQNAENDAVPFVHVAFGWTHRPEIRVNVVRGAAGSSA